MILRKRYTTTIRGSAWRPVTCEYCGCQYVYRLDLRALGSATTLWLLHSDKVANEANFNAEVEYSRKFREETGNFSCPNCGKYQKNMVKKIINKGWGYTVSLAFLLLLAWVILAFFIGGAILGPDVLNWWYPITFFGLVVFWAWVSIKWLIEAYQSNSDANVNKRRGQTYSKKYPILRRAEFEQMQAQTNKSQLWSS